MRKIAYWILSTLTVLVLLFSYRTSTASKASAAAITASPAVTAGAGTATAGSTSTSSSAGAAPAPPASSSTAGPATETPASSSSSAAPAPAAAQDFLGSSVDTRFGPVQVQITVQNGVITASDVTQVPWSNGKDRQINGRAVPVLNEETLAAQSSDIDMVSGATYTSEAYIESLQSAIDQANL